MPRSTNRSSSPKGKNNSVADYLTLEDNCFLKFETMCKPQLSYIITALHQPNHMTRSTCLLQMEGKPNSLHLQDFSPLGERCTKCRG